MLLVPEAGLPDLRAVALVPKPGGGGWVAWCTVEIAQETDAVAFDVRALTSRARLVVNSQPQERHPTDDAADQVFQRALGVACLAVGGTALAPCVDTVGWLATHECRSNQKTEDRTPMIAATVGGSPAMARQTVPQSSASP